MLYGAFGAKPLIETDFFARVTAGVQLANDLLVKKNISDLHPVVNELLVVVESMEKLSDIMRVTFIFDKAEENLKKGSISKNLFHILLDTLEKATENLPPGRKLWWLAEVYKRKAGIDSVTPETDINADYLRKSWEYARKASNFLILTEIGYHLSFRFLKTTKSIKDLAEIQASVVLGICHDGASIERLGIFGNNLTKCWKQIKYRRLAESDLPYIANLRDRAKRCEENNIPGDLQSPLMIMLLLKVTGRIQSEEYKRASDWALSKLEDNWEKVPEEDRTYLKNE